MATKTQQEIIKRFMRALDMTNASGRKALDAAVNYATGGYYSDFQAAADQVVADCKDLGADNFLLEKCGINLNNTDVGAITGADAGGSKIKTADSIVPESGKLDTTFSDTSFEIYGVTFRLGSSLTSANRVYMWQALKTWWAREGLKLNEESFGYSFNDTDAAAKEIIVNFKNENSRNYFAYVEGINKVSGRSVVKLFINEACFKTFAASDVNGQSSKYPTFCLDRTLAHEFTHALMMAKVNNYGKLPTFLKEGLGELTRGIDDLRNSVIKTVAKNPSTLNKIFNVEKNVTGVNAYVGGYIFLRWLAKQGAQNYLSTYDEETTTLSGKTLTLAENFSGKTLDLDDYSSKIKTVRASALDAGILIYGNDNANFLIGGSGNDTLIGGKGDDSLKGGDGKNIFVYSEGDDIIVDYSADDKISLTSVLDDTTLDGDDVIFKIVGGSLTVKNGKGKTLNIINRLGERYSTVLGGTTLTLTNAATSPVTADSSIKILDASARSKAIELVGNSKANSITGGKGDDTLTGNAGRDLFVHTAGDDLITDYSADDKISLSSAIKATTLDGSDVIFTTKKGSLTIQNGKGKTLNVITAGGEKFSTVLGSTTLTLTNSAASPVTVDADIKKIDASARTKATIITGNDKANSITGGSGDDQLHGGKGKDKLYGGKGDDTLWGDAGKDKFICGDGDDIIFGFQDGDTLSLDGLDFKTSYSKKNSVIKFKFDGGSVTFQDFSATTFHVDDSVYSIVDGKFNRQ
ncbi:MAG: hypothetical protein IKO05_01310 [Selenomonadaceae bacterium]|nr:hypothetical protein [Selenomonadaceae bacterium]